jgi:hypothetical protein
MEESVAEPERELRTRPPSVSANVDATADAKINA